MQYNSNQTAHESHYVDIVFLRRIWDSGVAPEYISPREHEMNQALRST